MQNKTSLKVKRAKLAGYSPKPKRNGKVIRYPKSAPAPEKEGRRQQQHYVATWLDYPDYLALKTAAKASGRSIAAEMRFRILSYIEGAVRIPPTRRTRR